MTVATEDEGELLFAGVGAALLVAALLDDDEGSLQFRKEVQTLHGFPWSEDHSRKEWRSGVLLVVGFWAFGTQKGI